MLRKTIRVPFVDRTFAKTSSPNRVWNKVRDVVNESRQSATHKCRLFAVNVFAAHQSTRLDFSFCSERTALQMIAVWNVCARFWLRRKKSFRKSEQIRSFASFPPFESQVSPCLSPLSSHFTLLPSSRAKPRRTHSHSCARSGAICAQFWRACQTVARLQPRRRRLS